MTKETIFALIFVVVIISGAVYAGYYINEEPQVEPPINNGEVTPPEENDFSMEELVQCLEASGVLIYGSQTCPYCTQLVDSFGGISVIKPIYFDCSGLGSEIDTEMCMEGMQTGYVPEIQINGEVYQGDRSPRAIAKRVGCEI